MTGYQTEVIYRVRSSLPFATIVAVLRGHFWSEGKVRELPKPPSGDPAYFVSPLIPWTAHGQTNRLRSYGSVDTHISTEGNFSRGIPPNSDISSNDRVNAIEHQLRADRINAQFVSHLRKIVVTCETVAQELIETGHIDHAN